MAKYAQRTRYPSFPKMPKAGSKASPLRFTSVTAIPQGPKLYSVFTKPTRVSDWDDPPPGFVVGQTSKTEWKAYKALDIVMKTIFGYTKDVRTPPFDGFPPFWGYQVDFIGGRQRGGSVVDFTVNIAGEALLIRVVSQRYHINTTAEKLASDEAQYRTLTRMGRKVIDVLESDLITDTTGSGAVKAMWNAVQGNSRQNPARSGTALGRIIPV